MSIFVRIRERCTGQCWCMQYGWVYKLIIVINVTSVIQFYKLWPWATHRWIYLFNTLFDPKGHVIASWCYLVQYTRGTCTESMIFHPKSRFTLHESVLFLNTLYSDKGVQYSLKLSLFIGKCSMFVSTNVFLDL